MAATSSYLASLSRKKMFAVLIATVLYVKPNNAVALSTKPPTTSIRPVSSSSGSSSSSGESRARPTRETNVDVDADAGRNGGGDGGGRGLVYAFSPSSLRHLEAVERPPEPTGSEERNRAVVGALGAGACAAAAASVLASVVVVVDDSLPVLAFAVGCGAGWVACGGTTTVVEAERPTNGGYDAKLVADRPSRLRAVLNLLKAEERDGVFAEDEDEDAARRRDARAVALLSRAHEEDHVRRVRRASRATDRPVRFAATFARTLIDQHTHDAAVRAAADWTRSVDAALDVDGGGPVVFALVRPPSHHARRGGAGGGCFYNSVAAAALHALDREDVDVVGVLDVDAHFGNGVAHCVQDEPRIRYCSLHETPSTTTRRPTEDDPRRPDEDDEGPLGNLRNVCLPKGTTWDGGYETALVDRALPFLRGCDVLLVAAGFDALSSDWSSGLRLEPEDYRKMGERIRAEFGDRVAFGLEGGYDAERMPSALTAFTEPWRKGGSA